VIGCRDHLYNNVVNCVGWVTVKLVPFILSLVPHLKQLAVSQVVCGTFACRPVVWGCQLGSIFVFPVVFTIINVAVILLSS